MLHKIKILSILFLTITFISCSETNVTSPVFNETNNENVTKRAETENSYPLTTITKTINGATGGIIYLTGIHIGPNLSIITVSATLTIPAGAFEGIRDITVTADYETPGIIFEPHMAFKRQLELDLLYTGLDLFALQLFPGQVDFGYLGDGLFETFEPCEYDGIDINLLAGLIGLRKAKIEHFSRYGYSR